MTIRRKMQQEHCARDRQTMMMKNIIRPAYIVICSINSNDNLTVSVAQIEVNLCRFHDLY